MTPTETHTLKIWHYQDPSLGPWCDTTNWEPKGHQISLPKHVQHLFGYRSIIDNKQVANSFRESGTLDTLYRDIIGKRISINHIENKVQGAGKYESHYGGNRDLGLPSHQYNKYSIHRME